MLTFIRNSGNIIQQELYQCAKTLGEFCPDRPSQFALLIQEVDSSHSRVYRTERKRCTIWPIPEHANTFGIFLSSFLFWWYHFDSHFYGLPYPYSDRQWIHSLNIPQQEWYDGQRNTFVMWAWSSYNGFGRSLRIMALHAGWPVTLVSYPWWHHKECLLRIIVINLWECCNDQWHLHNLDSHFLVQMPIFDLFQIDVYFLLLIWTHVMRWTWCRCLFSKGTWTQYPVSRHSMIRAIRH